mmetsp:Transcript_6043/g.19239  ORF Transcript_6043/g.19239 Transcript_6043/m.19239 type:complete len:518 (-) Transcript_6043:21-1574(-)
MSEEAKDGDAVMETPSFLLNSLPRSGEEARVTIVISTSALPELPDFRTPREGEPVELLLVTRKKSAQVVLPLSIARGIPFARDTIDGGGEAAPELRVVHEVPSERQLDALVQVMECMTRHPQQRLLSFKLLDINTSNQIDICEAARKLDMGPLLQQCERSIASTLSKKTIVDALQYSLRNSSRTLQEACYYWIKRNRVAVRNPATATDPESGMSHDPDMVWADASTRCIRRGRDSVSVEPLDPLAHVERRRKARYYVPRSVGSQGSGTEAEIGEGYFGTAKCYVERRTMQGPGKNETRFVLRRERGGIFVMAASMRRGNNFFVISMDEDDFSEDGPYYLGRVQGNFLGTQFILTDYGVSPETSAGKLFPHMSSRQHVQVDYKTNVMGRVPNSMTVTVIGAPMDEHQETLFQEWSVRPDARHAVGMFGEQHTLPRRVIHTRKPRWNPELDAWTLDFRGRVKLASKKNFQVQMQGSDLVLMLFGKVEKHRFSLDYQAPLTAAGAFAIALTSFADKLLVT